MSIACVHAILGTSQGESEEANIIFAWKFPLKQLPFVYWFVYANQQLCLYAKIQSVTVNSLGPRKTISNLEEHIATNFLGPYLLTLGLLPSIRAAGKEIGDARIVNVSSLMQTMTKFNRQDPMMEKPGSYTSEFAYSQSKLAVVRCIYISVLCIYLSVLEEVLMFVLLCARQHLQQSSEEDSLPAPMWWFALSIQVLS